MMQKAAAEAETVVAGHDVEQVEEDRRRRRNLKFMIRSIVQGPEVLHHAHVPPGRRQRLITTFGPANLIRRMD